MKNRIKIILSIILLNLTLFSLVNGKEQFNFDITEIEIIENGNKFLGKKRGIITTDDGIVIIANNFEYNKLTNIIILSGNVEIEDRIKKSKIFSENITYLKNQEIFFSNERSKVINDGVIIDADKIKYNKILNEVNAVGNVEVNDTVKKNILYAEDVTYIKSEEKIFTKGKTKIITNSKYDFDSVDVLLLRNLNELSSSKKSQVIENEKLYKFEDFKYFINTELLKAKNVEIISDYNKTIGERDNVKFDSGFFNLKENNFTASKTEVKLRKDTFDDSENDPRIYGVSSSSKSEITTINKAIFTSCKNEDGKCPPWSIKAKKVVHDKKKRQLIYDNAFLRVYDYPVLYFPKFFHPDPTVKRQAGFLQPQFNKSDILGSSLLTPYFIPISENRDYTFKPTIFDSNIYMFQHEYREKQKNSSLIADFSITKGYQSSLPNSNKNSITHLFAKYNLNLDLPNFFRSNLDVFFEKVSNDTYLKIFDNNLIETIVKPKDFNTLSSGVTLELDHKDYTFSTGVNMYESLQTNKSSDRYSYALPYYRFSRTFDLDKFGWIDFTSNGDNNLVKTNNLSTAISNGIAYHTNEYISDFGFKNNMGFYFTNLNTIAKNNNLYKSSPQAELLNIFEFNSSLPLQKIDGNYLNIIEPKISIRFNPDDMKNYSSLKRVINTDNVFDIGRLGLGADSYEQGKSLTLGARYKREDIGDINKYFELKLATVMREDDQEFIPSSSTINTKNSNIFGSIEYNYSEKLNLNYNFTLDNDFATFNYNSLGLTYGTEKLSHKIKFIEENGVIGTTNLIGNELEYNFDDKNFISFKTRRNRTINLTEYYDLIYQYKNDCLTAGIKYKKTYYQDRDVLPKEDLILTFTFYPLTTYEQEVDQNFYRGENAFDDGIKKLFD